MDLVRRQMQRSGKSHSHLYWEELRYVIILMFYFVCMYVFVYKEVRGVLFTPIF